MNWWRCGFIKRDMWNVLFINHKEVERLAIDQGDKVNIIALDKEKRLTHRRLDNLVVVLLEMADRCAVTYFPEANNLLSLNNYDTQSGIPAYKNIPILIEKI